MSQPYAVFDIDGTLIRWQLFHAIVHHLGKRGYLPEATHQNIRSARMKWKNRSNDDAYQQYEQALIDGYLAAIKTIPVEAYHNAIDEVFDEYKDQLFTYTRDLLHALKKEGYLLFAISGSHDEIVKKLAAYHGFNDVIGARLEEQNGSFTGELFTPVHDKYTALQQLLAQYDTHKNGSIAVGDTSSDIAILQHVETPIAFNPEQKLYDHALAHGWKIVVERKNVIYQITDGKK